MTVGDLRKELEGVPDDIDVIISDEDLHEHHAMGVRTNIQNGVFVIEL